VTNKITVLYDTIRLEEKLLIEAAKKNNFNLEMVDCKKLAIDLNEQSIIDNPVLQRCVSYYRNLHSTAALEGQGVQVVNCLNTGVFAGNKLFTHMLLQKAGVPTPNATVAFSKDSALESLKKNGFPKIIKPTVGSWGRMVSKINDLDSAEGIIEGREAMYPIHQVHFLEEFVERPPRDIRAIVIGNNVAAAIYRNSGDGHWKTNTHLGGFAETCKITNELEDICLKAMKSVQGNIVGVDLMESKEKGLVVHEINNTTEFRNVVRVTGVDIPSLMLEHVNELSK
jgi:[lysine-biosynthesis-protein LysW]--L-2-aminoadipate ligase|tara:strand:+ start:11019 stop:11867 length:849 start_codon:yes stop_codon:yes gene_type:complete